MAEFNPLLLKVFLHWFSYAPVQSLIPNSLFSSCLSDVLDSSPLQDVFRSIAESLRQFSNPKGDALARLTAVMVKALLLRICDGGFEYTTQSPKHVTTQVSALRVAAPTVVAVGNTAHVSGPAGSGQSRKGERHRGGMSFLAHCALVASAFACRHPWHCAPMRLTS